MALLYGASELLQGSSEAERTERKGFGLRSTFSRRPKRRKERISAYADSFSIIVSHKTPNSRVVADTFLRSVSHKVPEPLVVADTFLRSVSHKVPEPLVVADTLLRSVSHKTPNSRVVADTLLRSVSHKTPSSLVVADTLLRSVSHKTQKPELWLTQPRRAAFSRSPPYFQWKILSICCKIHAESGRRSEKCVNLQNYCSFAEGVL